MNKQIKVCLTCRQEITVVINTKTELTSNTNGGDHPSLTSSCSICIATYVNNSDNMDFSFSLNQLVCQYMNCNLIHATIFSWIQNSVILNNIHLCICRKKSLC